MTRLVRFTLAGSSGGDVWINPASIEIVRPSQPGRSPSVNIGLTGGGTSVAVSDAIEDVLKALEG